MYTLQPCELERWYSRYGACARYNLSSSAAHPLSTAAVLNIAGPAARDEYINLDLNYTPQQGTLRLRQAIAARYTTLNADAVQVTTGAAEALFLALSALVQPDDVCVVQFPIYPSIVTLAAHLGARVLHWPMLPDGGWSIDYLATLLRLHRVRVLILNHPHGPTGALLSNVDLATIAALTREHGTTLIVDEVYRGVQFGGEWTPAAADLGDHTVSIGDLAKPYGLGGLRIGWLASHDSALTRRCAELRDYTTLCSSTPGEFLAALALEHHSQILGQQLALAAQNRRLWCDADLPWLKGELADGGFTIFPAVRHARPTRQLAHELCEQHDVLVLPGEVYGVPGHLRIGFGVEPTQFAAGVERLLAYQPRCI